MHIEDTFTNLMLVQVFPEEKGILVTEAKTGRDALKLLSENHTPVTEQKRRYPCYCFNGAARKNRYK